MPVAGQNALKMPGRVHIHQAAPAVGAIDHHHGFHKAHPVGVAQKLKIKGHILGVDHRLQKLNAVGAGKFAPQHQLPHAPVGAVVKAAHTLGIAFALKSAGHQMHLAGRGNAAGGFIQLKIAPNVQIKAGIFLHIGFQMLQHGLGPVVVAVQKQQPLAPGGVHAGDACPGKAAVVLMDHPHARIAFGKGITHGGALVGAAIVHQNTFQTGALRKHAAHALGKIGGHIVNRHDHTEFRLDLLLHENLPVGIE